jgi:signal recognition particle subunit SRP54
MDGDARGGAALSMRAVTEKPIKFIGTGEKLDGLDSFDPGRVAGRILGMGDVVSLVERAAETVNQDEAEKLAAKMAKGQFDMNDLRAQLGQMKRMGGMGALMGMLPGVGKLQKQAEAAGVNDKLLGRMEAIILSMTPKERVKPEIVNAKRKIRIANGAGTTVQEVNKVLKMHQEMANTMKKLKKMGGMKGLAGLMGKMPGGLQGLLGGLGGGGGGAPGGMPQLPPGFDKFMKR